MSQGEVEEFYAVYDRNIRLSRKHRECCACGEAIKAGHRYCHIYAVGGGEVFHFDRCLRCEAMFTAIKNRSESDEAIAECLDCGHTWDENFGEPPPPEISLLAFMSPDEAQRELK